MVAQPTSVPITAELTGRTVASQTSEVRPQVGGVIQRRFFTEGQVVRQGQPLYQIDPSLYRAAIAQAEANLQSAVANQVAAQELVDRYRPLTNNQVISKQDYSNAVARAGQAAAAVAQSRAALETARINLRFSTVPAPISGRIGRSLLTVGALATTGQGGPLATIQQLDPMYVDIQQSSADLLALRRSLAEEGVAQGSAQVRLKLEDGSAYPSPGVIEFSEVVVDPATGTVTLRANVPNPDGLLLPGMFVRAEFARAVNTSAYLVPQSALLRDAKGVATVYIAAPDDKAVIREVTADRALGSDWVVTKGLAPGDRVIAQGVGKLRPGATIRAVPAAEPERIAPPKPGKPSAAPAGAAAR